MKHCNQCLESKPTTEFSKRTASKDGLQNKCKTCNAKVNRRFRNTYPQYKKEWDHKNPGAQTQIMREWTRRNPEKHKANVYKYYSKLGAGVYRVNNLVTKESYIGSSQTLVQRMNQHFNSNHKGASNKNLQNAMREYGVQWFSFEILEHCIKENLLEREQFWIDLLKPEYNDANAVKKDIN